MGSGFEHAALVVFTTLAPMGAGAFIVLTYAFLAASKAGRKAPRPLDRAAAGSTGRGLCGCVHAPGQPSGSFRGIRGRGILAAFERDPGGRAVRRSGCDLLGAWPGRKAVRRRASRVPDCAVGSGRRVLGVLRPGVHDAHHPHVEHPDVHCPDGGLHGGRRHGAGILHCRIRPGRTAKGAGIDSSGPHAGRRCSSLCGFGMQIAGVEASNIWGSAAQLVPAIGMMLAAFAACGLLGQCWPTSRRRRRSRRRLW